MFKMDIKLSQSFSDIQYTLQNAKVMKNLALNVFRNKRHI